MFYDYLNRYHQYDVKKPRIAACSVFLRLNTLALTGGKHNALLTINNKESLSDLTPIVSIQLGKVVLK